MKVILGCIALLTGGCNFTCNQMNAPSRVTVAFDEGRTWEPGVWEIEADGYTHHAMCVVALPYVEGDLVSCTGNAELVLSDDGAGILALEASNFEPESFAVRVERDGGPVGDESFAPEYAIDEPNGKGCGDRAQATVQMSL
jgi:hypothetical protein